MATVTRSDYVEGKPFAQVEAKPLVALDRLRYLLLLWTDKKPEVHDDEEAPTLRQPRLRRLRLRERRADVATRQRQDLDLALDPAGP